MFKWLAKRRKEKAEKHRKWYEDYKEKQIKEWDERATKELQAKIKLGWAMPVSGTKTTCDVCGSTSIYREFAVGKVPYLHVRCNCGADLGRERPLNFSDWIGEAEGE